LRSRIDLQAQNQQKQLDQALADLETLERATQKFATKLEVERTSQNIIEQINDVDARVQSLAEQVEQVDVARIS
jgi:archaellum component FlaC